MHIIGLSGKAGSGKDYIAVNILRKMGYYPISFAWHLKINVIGRGLATYEDVFHTKQPWVREMLQREGTELGRMVYGENVWVSSMYGWMRLLSEVWGIEKFVVGDVRFPNELEFLQSKGGWVLRVLAPNRVAASPLTEEQRQHSSETALDNVPLGKFDGFILNDVGYESTLETRVRRTVELLESQRGETQ